MPVGFVKPFWGSMRLRCDSVLGGAHCWDLEVCVVSFNLHPPLFLSLLSNQHANTCQMIQILSHASDYSGTTVFEVA